MGIRQKFIIHDCPAIYDYYPLDKEKQKCCYRAKDTFCKEHHQCKDSYCRLKQAIENYTFRNGTMQEFLHIEWIEEYA